jgi:hypothetical protein
MLPCRPLFACIVVLLSLAVTPSSAADRGPNFIFVIADDHRWDAMGVVQREQGDQARYPWFETPSMDRSLPASDRSSPRG